MPENYTLLLLPQQHGLKKEIRHQPRAWIRSLTNIDALHSALNNFLEPLLRKEICGSSTERNLGIYR